MPPAHRNTAAALPLERSDAQGILLKHMAVLNQHLLSPWEDADGKMHPRLTMAEAVAQLYEWSTAYATAPARPRLRADGALDSPSSVCWRAPLRGRGSAHSTIN